MERFLAERKGFVYYETIKVQGFQNFFIFEFMKDFFFAHTSTQNEASCDSVALNELGSSILAHHDHAHWYAQLLALVHLIETQFIAEIPALCAIVHCI